MQIIWKRMRYVPHTQYWNIWDKETNQKKALFSVTQTIPKRRRTYGKWTEHTWPLSYTYTGRGMASKRRGVYNGSTVLNRIDACEMLGTNLRYSSDPCILWMHKIMSPYMQQGESHVPTLFNTALWCHLNNSHRYKRNTTRKISPGESICGLSSDTIL